MKLQVFLPAVLAVFLATQSSSFADGGFVTSFTSHYPQLQEPEQKGIVLYQEGREDLLLEVKYQGAAEDFVWLVPLPSRPEVTVDAEGVFADMRRQIQFWQPPSAVDPWRPGQGERFLPRRAYQPAASIWNFEVLPPERKVLEKWIDDHALNVSANA